MKILTVQYLSFPFEKRCSLLRSFANASSALLFKQETQLIRHSQFTISVPSTLTLETCIVRVFKECECTVNYVKETFQIQFIGLTSRCINFKLQIFIAILFYSCKEEHFSKYLAIIAFVCFDIRIIHLCHVYNSWLTNSIKKFFVFMLMVVHQIWLNMPGSNSAIWFTSCPTFVRDLRFSLRWRFTM